MLSLGPAGWKKALLPQDAERVYLQRLAGEVKRIGCGETLSAEFGPPAQLMTVQFIQETLQLHLGSPRILDQGYH